ncbi:DUF4123 domain-containing protein [Rhodovulum sulfidophilum]|uniref:DUF4123 domain-containing protein n=1 Tax=Rhodovulum sulfidophilum TaxID=35806 RepID=A0ABS1RY29_RHOSU|nr:DUF4123 domain-containing protein [Rhodovulum sulfidophilum]MBL3611001.1 DUF4123 domain-containing protein [Rhodovulum sulfidophilum]MCE8455691.1 DUF4123 domain-containing protein [Rhodovulum sulfidophilum]
MRTDTGHYDWLQASKREITADEHAPRIEVIAGVEPLDGQFGVLAPKSVPDKLHTPLFGQPEPNPAEIALGVDISAAPSLGTFAVLDAARLPNLPEILSASGLEYACLFKGGAADELQDVAPWIVRLEDESRFTRNIFTQGDAPWAMWGQAPGIYLRSRDGLDDVRNHLRKFIRARDDEGTWFYLRLYDPRIMRAFLQGAPRFAHRLLARPFPWSNLTILTCFEDSAQIASPAENVPADMRPIRIGSEEKAVFRHLTFEARAAALMARLGKSNATSMSTDPNVRLAQKSAIISAFHRMYDYGFQQPLQQDRWGLWELFYGAGFEMNDPILKRICDTSDAPSGVRFAAFQRRLEEIYS